MTKREFTIPIKPMTVNKVWRGRRFKTKEYKAWKEEVGWLISKQDKVEGWIGIEFKFYIKYYNSDTDNFIKSTLDALVEANKIDDDRYVKWIRAEKFKSKDERIEIAITKLDEETRQSME